MNSGDTAWVLIASALVMLMTPGLAFFYGGLVRRKNFLSVLMQCFAILAVVSIQWVLVGYSLAFAPNSGPLGAFIGGLQWVGLKGVAGAPYADYAATIPHLAFMIFQMMFAVITPALIIGALAERIKFSGFLVFTILWATLIYDPVAHWVWGMGGWLRTMGALDFAGGTVVHICSGVSALAAALLIGRRKTTKAVPPHNLPMAALGAGLLWFGWFGFNAGSALAANELAANAFVVTHIAAAAAALMYMALEAIFTGKATMLGTITGGVAGLVAITPASGFVSVGSSIVIGFGVSIVCYIAITVIKRFFNYDDTLDAFGVHGVGGMFGALATGFFASKAINPAGAEGLIHGNAALVGTQLIAIGATAAYAFIGTVILFKIVDWVIGMRVSEHEENMGLDLSQHHEAAYTVLE
jgi:Amt family ammonium transporter